MMGTGLGVFFGLLMLIFWVIIIVGIVLLVVYLVRRGGAPYAGMPPTGMPPMGATMGGEDRALQILKERYAKGEISKEEYDRMSQDLR